MFLQQNIAQNADLNFFNKERQKMELLMSTPNLGIITLLVLAMMIFFQVIIHNTKETKRFDQLNEHMKRLEEKIEKLGSK
jgi:hypothetical protein